LISLAKISMDEKGGTGFEQKEGKGGALGWKRSN